MIYSAPREPGVGGLMRNLTMWKSLAIAFEAGTAMATAVLLGLVIGHVIDDRFGGEIPIFTIAGALIGFAAGVVGMVRLAFSMNPQRKE